MDVLARVVFVLLLVGWLAEPAAAQRSKARAAPQPAAQQAPIDVEQVYYRQLTLVDETRAALLPSEPSQPSVYFVGFSAFATQDVFIREIVAARDIVEQRFGTRGRSVLLVNHRETLDEVPIASATNLDVVLARLGKIMNPDKDILFLFMTSHGQRGQLAVHFPGFNLNWITPERIADVIARAGIRRRIIVLSACFSGSFVPALRAPEALVMTAARADRASFGCSHQRAWTYFGDALFNRSIRETSSLLDAFDNASGLVRKWEATEKLTPSEPQIFVGDVIRPALEGLAERFGRSAAAAN